MTQALAQPDGPPSSARPKSERRNDLDWLRAVLFLGLIGYHVGLLYAPFSPYFVKSEHSHPAVEIVLLASHPWRMSLLFLISGVATRFMAGKLPARRLYTGRSFQLLPPLLLGFVLLMPIQAYLMLANDVGYNRPVLEFLQSFFASPGHELVHGGRTHPLPVYGHLWFILYLWGYTTVVCALLGLGSRWVRMAQGLLERVLNGPWVIIAPIAILAALRFTLFPIFSITLHVQADWYNHAVSFGMFLFGFLIAFSQPVWTAIERARWAGLALAALAYVAYAAVAVAVGGQPEPLEMRFPAMHFLNAVQQWGATVACLGFAHRHLRSVRKAPQYLNRGIFTFYIIHQPALLLAIHFLKKAKLDVGPEFLAVVALTMAACAGAYELARRLGWLAPLLGQRPPPKDAADPAMGAPLAGAAQA